MKLNLKNAAAVVAAAFVFISCVEEQMAPETYVPEGIPSFTATLDGPDTKTVLDGNISMWQGEESIQIVGKNGNYKFSASVSGAAKTTVFTYAGEDRYDEEEIMAVYPYGSGSYGGDIANRQVSNVNIPSVQTAVEGSYDPDAAVAVAYSSNSSLQFKNATALLKFTMGSGGIKNVTVWGEMSEVEGVMPGYYQEGNVYLTVHTDWKSDGARFAAYFFEGNSYIWKDMTAVAGQVDMFTCEVPSGYSKVIFCRMNPASSANGWSNKWNQTADLNLADGNMFTVTSPWGGEEDKAEGSWSTISATSTAGISGSVSIAYNDGEPVVTGASNGYVSLNGDFVKGQTYYIAVAPVVFEKGFTVQFSTVGDSDKFDVKSTSKKVEFKRNVIYDLGTISTGESDIPSEPMPAGLEHGINYIDDSTVTLVLYDRDKRGKSHDFCNLLWDGNKWAPENDKRYPKRPLNWDADAGCWWITLTDLDPDKQYKFQYQLGYGDEVTVTTFDPYSEIVYDTWNDGYIKDSTYPDLSTEYGTQYGSGSNRRDKGLISAFKINRDEYAWEIAAYDIEDENDLIIYELLLRDFTDNSYGEGSLSAAFEQLDYIETLGVNAIELMPIQEFDGNDSWGYNPCAYFAMDKAYGTRNMYKQFIDECHKRGIAVFLDVVYNHATGSHPYAAMYWDGTNNKTASNNPWFNVDAPHLWSVYHDWNHENTMVRDHVKRSLTYLIEEYKIDGFRFDLTKGFTQNSGKEGSYDQSRVDILKDYNAHIKSVDPNAIMICEHFVDDENWVLGMEGIKVWRNMNHSYTKALRRNMADADFSGTTNSFNSDGTMADWNHFGMLVGYQESHDEERTAYLGQWEDNNGPEIPFATRMERAKINAAFFLLSPGPKMIWQFGEIGYDISGGNGDTSKKPWKTAEYMAVAERKALYDTYAMLIKFRKDNPRFFDSDVNFRWYVGYNEQTGRYLFAKSSDGKQFALFGNFGKGSKSLNVTLPKDGKWYQYDTGAVWEGSTHNPTMDEGQFYILVDDKSLCLK